MAWTRSYNPIWYAPDLTGAPMDDTYYFFVLQNVLPYLPSTIYHDESQTVAWSNPIQLLANGTLPVDMYFNDELVYRLEWRAGPTQSDALIYVVENYSPSANSVPEPGGSSSSSENQITNPQFATVNFIGSLVIGTAGTYDIAPGWQLIAAGSGTVTVSQDTYIGSDWTADSQTNAPYGLSIIKNGFTSVILRQTFHGNGALWTGAQSLGAEGPGVAFNVTASADDPVTLTANITYSDLSTASLLNQALLTTNNDYFTSTPILESFNTDSPDVAYTQLNIVMTSSSTYHITSVQLVGQTVVGEIPYIQTTLERQKDEEFNVYNAELQYKPIPSYLTGWDFPLNPAQFGDTVVVAGLGTSASQYVWDQTLAFQTADALTITRDSGTNGIKIATASNSSFALVQYLTAAQAREILSQRNSVQIQGRVSTGTLVGYVNMYWTTDATLPDATSVGKKSLVSTITAGVPTIGNGTWNKVARPALANNDAKITLTSTNTAYSFSQFDASATAGKTTATFFAIVISFDTMLSTTTAVIDYCSLVGGDIATRPAPQTPDAVLRECQYYYEKSYNTSDVATPTAGVNTVNGLLNFPMDIAYSYTSAAGVINFNAVVANSFSLQWQTTKCNVPTVYLYSKAGTVANVSLTIAGASAAALTDKLVATYWTTINKTTKSAYYLPVTPNGANAIGACSGVNAGAANYNVAWISVQYVADSRLGTF